MAELVHRVDHLRFAVAIQTIVHSCDSPTLNSEHKKKSSPIEDDDDFFLMFRIRRAAAAAGKSRRSRIFNGAPARQPELTPASRKMDGSAAEGSTTSTLYKLQRIQNSGGG